jgi:hypothetical protein
LPSSGVHLYGNKIFGGNSALVMIYFRGEYPAFINTTAFGAGHNENPNLTIDILPEYTDDWNLKGQQAGMIKNGPIAEGNTMATWGKGQTGNPIAIGSWEQEITIFNSEQWLHVDAIKMLKDDDVDLTWNTDQITLSGSYRYVICSSTDLFFWEQRREIDTPPTLRFFRVTNVPRQHKATVRNNAEPAPEGMFFKVTAVK